MAVACLVAFGGHIGASVPEGCMGQAVENDPVFDDIWHGGWAGPPEIDERCDIITHECEFEEPVDVAIYTGEHGNWDPGYVYNSDPHYHDIVEPCPGWNG